MSRKTLTHEEFLEKFYVKNENAENIEILGKYEKSNIKIKCKCKVDGYEWETTPNVLLRGYGCPKCAGVKRKNTEQFIQELEKINSNIEVVGEYVNARTKIKVRCKIDGYIWEVVPNSLLNGRGCPKCSNKVRKDTEYFINEMKNINNNIEFLGEYKGAFTKIKCKCKIDNYEWYTVPNSLLNGQSCPKCGGTMKLTHEEFVNRMKEINDDIEILGEYVNHKTKIKCKCKIDNTIWFARPNGLLRGTGCPKCNESKGEKRISKYLDSKNMKYKTQYRFNDCKSKYTLPFDFYIPSLNIAIEYDGEYHYKIIIRGKNDTYEKAMDKFITTKIHDTIKTIYCKENEIKLVRIPYWDFDRIEEILEKELEEV